MAIRIVHTLALFLILNGCSSINYVPSPGMAKVTFQRMKPNSECTGNGVELDEVKFSNGRIEKVKTSPFYLPPGGYTFYYYPEFQEFTDRGGCLEMVMVTADAEQSISAVLEKGLHYSLEVEGRNAYLKAM